MKIIKPVFEPDYACFMDLWIYGFMDLWIYRFMDMDMDLWITLVAFI